MTFIAMDCHFPFAELSVGASLWGGTYRTVPCNVESHLPQEGKLLEGRGCTLLILTSLAT